MTLARTRRVGPCCRFLTEGEYFESGRLRTHAAPDVLEDLHEGDPVCIDPLAAGHSDDDPVQAVVYHQVRPDLLAGQGRRRRAKHLCRATLGRLDLAVGRLGLPPLVVQGRQLRRG